MGRSTEIGTESEGEEELRVAAPIVEGGRQAKARGFSVLFLAPFFTLDGFHAMLKCSGVLARGFEERQEGAKRKT